MSLQAVFGSVPLVKYSVLVEGQFSQVNVPVRVQMGTATTFSGGVTGSLALSLRR